MKLVLLVMAMEINVAMGGQIGQRKDKLCDINSMDRIV